MSESGNKNDVVGSDSKNKADDVSHDKITLNLDFAPSWARTSPDEHIKSVRTNRYDEDGGTFGRGDGGRHGRRDNWRESKGRDDRFNRRDRGRDDKRKPTRQRDDGPAGDRKFKRPDTMTATAFPCAAQESRPTTERRYDGQRRQGGNREFRGSPRFEQPALPLEIRVLPEQKALGAVIRRIQSSHRAFPLRDIAWLFLDKPGSCLIRIAQQKEEGELPLFQCKVCGLPALSEEEIQNHLLNRHLEDFFDVEEVECEPPGGQFVCVMRCGLTGELLGPPNHHSFNTKVHEMLRTKFPEMSEEAYRRKIESMREPELIEQWRQASTKKKIYRRKTVAETVLPPVEPVVTASLDDAENTAGDVQPIPSIDDNEVKAPPMERDVAELIFKREMLPGQYAEHKHLVCIASIALQTPSRQLYFAIREMINKEKRFPTSLFFALRGAFRHRKLYLFRANDAKGADFVMQKKPTEFDPTFAVEMVKNIITYLQANPACTKVELVHALAGSDDAKIKDVLGQLAWLIEKGSIIEYYNDVLSAPGEYPSFRLLQSEKKHAKGKETIISAAHAETAPKQEEIAVEVQRSPSGTPASKEVLAETNNIATEVEQTALIDRVEQTPVETKSASAKASIEIAPANLNSEVEKP